MTKWEYKAVGVDAKLTKANMIKAVEEESNKYGEEGWELVNFSKEICKYVILEMNMLKPYDEYCLKELYK